MATLRARATPLDGEPAPLPTLAPTSTPAPTPAPTGDRALAQAALAGAAAVLGWTLQVSSGHVHPTAILGLTAALALAALGVAAPRAPRVEALGELPAVAVLACGILVEVGELLVSPPAMFIPPSVSLVPFRVGVACAGALALAGLARSPAVRRVQLPLLLGVHFLLGAWVLHASPAPVIDVHVVQRGGLEALLGGRNPYAITFPNPYHSTVMYGPGQADVERLHFGYCYPPLALVLALPGHLVGDYRYAQLAAMTATAALLGRARPGRLGPLAAALLLCTPRVFYVLEQGWTDPFVALVLAATVYTALRAPRLVPLALGLFLAVKQYTFLAAPAALALLLASPSEASLRARVRGLAVAAAVALAVSLPFALWDLRAFLWNVLELQFRSPFRRDALSYLAWIARRGGPELPSLVGFAAGGAAMALGLVRAARTPAGFAAATALAFLAFFAFNKQAFSNYYFFVIAALCASVAASRGIRSPAA
jgi:hypothetical protein